MPQESTATNVRALGVLSGGDMPGSTLKVWLESASMVLAADSAADTVLQLGKLADYVVGDLGSISERALAAHSKVIRDPDQGSTDCDKLLELARELELSSITLANIEGDRFDHMIATVSSAIRSPLMVRLALRQGVGWVLKPNKELVVGLEPGTGVALLPVMPSSGVVLRGVTWPLHDAVLSLGGLISVSNRAESETVCASIASGVALLIVDFSPDRLPLW